MVDGTVQTLVQVQPPGQNLIWIGGKFTHVMKTRKLPVASVDGLAVLDDVTGAPPPLVHVPVLSRSTGDPVVFDMALSPDASVLYIAGVFNTVDGSPRKNVAAIDPATGALLPFAPNAQSASSISATATTVFVGGVKPGVQLDGTAHAGVHTADGRHRSHAAVQRDEGDIPRYRGVRAPPSSSRASATRSSTPRGCTPRRRVVEIDGRSERCSRGPRRTSRPTAGRWGWRCVGTDPLSGFPTVYLAAGGSDFAAAYDFVTGAQIWKTDTSGSSQVLRCIKAALIVGGHFVCTESPTTPQCGKNDGTPRPGVTTRRGSSRSTPRREPCSSTPRPAQPWNPGICCIYQGCGRSVGRERDVAPRGRRLQEGGRQWMQDGSTGAWDCSGSAKSSYYARFSDLPPPPPPP